MIVESLNRDIEFGSREVKCIIVISILVTAILLVI